MSDKLPEPTPDELKRVEQAKARHKEGEQFKIYPSVEGGIEGILRDRQVTQLYPIAEFYKPSLVTKALNELVVTKAVAYLDAKGEKQQITTEVEYTTAQGEKRFIDRQTIKQRLADNIGLLKAFYEKQKQKPLAVTTYGVITAEALPKLEKYFDLETIQPNQWIPGTVTITKDINGASHAEKQNVSIDELPELKETYATKPITGYLFNDKKGLIKTIESLTPSEYLEYKSVEIMASQEGNTVDGLKSLFTDLIELTNACGLTDDSGQVMTIGDLVVNQIHLETLGIISRTLLGVLESNKPYEQINMFSNIAMGVDTAEIVGRHQFFTGMHRGFSKIGEQGLYEAITKAEDRHERVIIPYETRGSSSVYTTKLATSVEIGNVTKPLISNETDAKRLSARLIKTQGILYLWAMHTNSLTIYNTKVADMLRLTGYKGRIKPEHYEDITEGIKGLFAIVIDKTADHYNDPVTGEYVKLGKNELYGALIRPIGELEVIWQLSNKVYEYTDTELENLSMEVKESLEAVGQGERVIEMIDEKPTKTIPVTKYYLILRTEKKTDKKGREIVTKVYEQQAVYIKKILRLKMADGMLNPTTRRATVISKPLLLLNTLQERQYIQLGDYISSLFDQYQTKTAQGLPIEIAIQTLLEYRGLADPDSLSRVKQTKTYLKQALDKLVTIGHIAKWTVRNGDYEKLTLAGKDLKAVILIYPTENVQKVYKSPIGDDDKELTAILTQEVRADGLTTTAERYGVNTEVIEAVINNRDTADSLPLKAYNELKAKAYDKAKAGNKQAKKTTRTKKVYGYKYRGK